MRSKLDHRLKAPLRTRKKNGKEARWSIVEQNKAGTLSPKSKAPEGLFDYMNILRVLKEWW